MAEAEAGAAGPAEGTHRAPPEGGECRICYEDLNESVYLEYRCLVNAEEGGDGEEKAGEDGGVAETPPRMGQWMPCAVCCNCAEHMRRTQFGEWCKRLRETKCKAEQRRMLKAGPPVHLRDRHAFPPTAEAADAAAQIAAGTAAPGAAANAGEDEEVPEVGVLWFASDGEEHSSMLEGALTGEERLNFWEEQKAFLIADENDEDSDNEAEAGAEAGADQTTTG